MLIVYLSIIGVLSAIYFVTVRARIKKATGKTPKGWDSLDEEMPYLAVFGVSATVCFFLAAVVFYYFDLGIEATAEDVRHGLYGGFLIVLLSVFFAFFVPRILHFRYKTCTFSKPPPNFGALFLIISTFIALWPLMKYVAELITKWIETVWWITV